MRSNKEESNKNNKDIKFDDNTVVIVTTDDNGKDHEKKIYADPDGRYLWIARDDFDIVDGTAKFIRCNESQRKDMLELLRGIRKDLKEGKADVEYRMKPSYNFNKKTLDSVSEIYR